MSLFDPFKKLTELKHEYNFTCKKCGHSQMMKPSFLMFNGINTGGGRCLKCKAYLRLKINEDSDTCESHIFEENVNKEIKC